MSAWLRARLQVERDPHLPDSGAVPAGGRLGQALLLVIVLVVVASALVPPASVPVPAASALVPAAIVDARRAAAVLLVLGLRLALLQCPRFACGLAERRVEHERQTADDDPVGEHEAGDRRVVGIGYLARTEVPAADEAQPDEAEAARN